MYPTSERSLAGRPDGPYCDDGRVEAGHIGGQN